MKNLISFFVLVAFPTLSHAGQSQWSLREVPTPPSILNEKLGCLPTSPHQITVDELDLINLGKVIWTVVEKGRPVMNLQNQSATALPRGANCWNDLEAWQLPQVRTYELTYKNAMGLEVVKYAYRLVWLSGGQLRGVGRYIGYAALVPASARVLWGFQLNSDASVPVIFNLGTREAPVAAMHLHLRTRVDSILIASEESTEFVIDGDGGMRVLSPSLERE